MKISRLLAILTLLLRREKVTSAELAERFEVSVRTIIRDMQTISEAGIPIVSYQGYEGGYGLVEGYKIDKHLMNPEEMSITIAVLKGMENAIGNRSIRTLIEKFECLSAEDRNNDRIQVDLTPWGISDFEKQKLTNIHKGIKNDEVIEISYIDRNGNTSVRRIEPLMLGLKLSVWYLYAYCRVKKDFRLFKVMRIKDITLTGIGFIRKDFNASQIFDDEKENGSMVHLKLKFDSKGYSRAFDFFECENMTFLKDGKILVEVDYPEDEWVYSVLLGFGSLVEIIEPNYIREIICERAKTIIDKYQ